MVSLDHFFSKKPSAKPPVARDAGPTNPPSEDEQALERKTQRLERRELLYAVVRESMARVGMLSSSYKYKVLSLDSRGKQYLIMMDLPKAMIEHIGHLAEIEEVITQNARQRHKIDVSAVYWRINELSKPSTAVLRKPRAEPEPSALTPVVTDIGESLFSREGPQAPLVPGDRQRRFEPIRPDEVKAFKQGLAAGSKGGAPSAGGASRMGSPTEFPATEFPPTEFEETRMDEGAERSPLSRTQYGDLI